MHLKGTSIKNSIQTRAIQCIAFFLYTGPNSMFLVVEIYISKSSSPYKSEIYTFMHDSFHNVKRKYTTLPCNTKNECTT